MADLFERALTLGILMPTASRSLTSQPPFTIFFTSDAAPSRPKVILESGQRLALCLNVDRMFCRRFGRLIRSVSIIFKYFSLRNFVLIH